ncbi:hypothetical protein BDR07DRAFT_1420341 [Suillus spraguei]|nr:hypothetical protein BDR07DRAFT_1420341 [Suillus spraguei]
MRLSILAVVVALTASMFVSACSLAGQTCVTSNDCCINMDLFCEPNIVSMSRSLCNQDSTIMMTCLHTLGWN